MKYFTINDDCGSTWIKAENVKAARIIAESEFCGYTTIKEISKEEYDKEMKDFDLAKQIHDELIKEYNVKNMSIKEYSQLCKAKREEVLKRGNNN